MMRKISTKRLWMGLFVCFSPGNQVPAYRGKQKKIWG